MIGFESSRMTGIHLLTSLCLGWFSQISELLPSNHEVPRFISDMAKEGGKVKCCTRA